MSILDRFLKKGSAIPRGAAFRITQEGREKIQDFTGDAQSRILVTLESQGTSCDIDEISQNSKLGKTQVEKLVPVLVKKGYISYIGPHSTEE